MRKFRAGQQKRMARLANEAGEAKSELCDKLAVAERILVQVELAGKLETEREKVCMCVGE